MSYVVVMATCANDKESGKIATLPVQKGLAACVQGSRIQSIFRWKGNIEEAREVQLLIKARLSDFGEIEKLIKEHHSYENPEIIAIPIVAGSQAYLDWIRDETEREIE